MLQYYIDKVQIILVCFYLQQMLYWFLKHMQHFKGKVCIKEDCGDFFFLLLHARISFTPTNWKGKQRPIFSIRTICGMNLPLTSVATANHVRKVGESFIAVVALAAAEEDLRVFLHVDTLLPKTVDDTPALFALIKQLLMLRWCCSGLELDGSKWGFVFATFQNLQNPSSRHTQKYLSHVAFCIEPLAELPRFMYSFPRHHSPVLRVPTNPDIMMEIFLIIISNKDIVFLCQVCL